MSSYTALNATLRKLSRRFLPLKQQMERTRYGRFEALMMARYGRPERPRRCWRWVGR